MSKAWRDIQISFGDGDRIAKALEYMRSSKEDERETGYWQVQNGVVLQGSLFEGAYYVIDSLLDMLDDVKHMDKFRPLDILYEIFNGYAEPDNMITVEDSGEKKQLTEACRHKIVANKARIEKTNTLSEKEQNAKAELLEFMENPSPLFPSKEEIEQMRIELEKINKKL